jgi:hypothetical protein
MIVAVLDDGAPLFAHQALGVDGQGRDKRQQEGEDDFLHSLDMNWLRLGKYGFFLLVLQMESDSFRKGKGADCG